MRPGIVLDFNGSKEVVGIEVLGERRRVPTADPTYLKFDVAEAVSPIFDQSGPGFRSIRDQA